MDGHQSDYQKAANALGALTFEQRLDIALGELRTMLLEKSLTYNNPAINPVRIFSAASPVEQIKVLLDNKHSRAVLGLDSDENVEEAFVGYYVLLMVARQIEREREL